ncbi:MAG: hypothetical protein JEZ14_18280 [Marinilabiliaceae bacterium]|nr:hypothetical protein [Marinilabiliaceae bacterium]
MNKNSLGLILLMLLSIVSGYAQSKGQVLFAGDKKIKSGSSGYSFYFSKGDKLNIQCETKNGKELSKATIKSNSGSTIFEKKKFASMNEVVNITKDGIYTVEFKAKAMGSRDSKFSISRNPGSTDKNIAFTKNNHYQVEEVTFSIDSMIGYKEPEKSVVDFTVFDKYYYQEVPMFSTSKQILGQMGVHSSQAACYKLGIEPGKVPANAKLKAFSYSFSSVLGGAKHWKIADYSTKALSVVASAVLTPAAGFAITGTMTAIGPRPGNEPSQYFMSYRASDEAIVKKIYSFDKTQREARNVGASMANGISNALGGGDVARKVKVPSESELSFNEKGKVTRMTIIQATQPKANYFIMANPENTQAKNTKLNTTAIYYAPGYKKIQAEKRIYNLETVTVEKKAKKYTNSYTYDILDY